MNKTKGKTIEKWIDLSGLPRNNLNGHVDWSKSVGVSLKFKYGEIDSNLIIMDNFPKECRVSIYIENYTSEDGYKIARNSVLNCNLGELLREKIATSNPSIMQYLVDPNDAYIYSAYSKRLVKAQCPLCGYEKSYRISDLSNYGFSCNRCGDGVSYPNKFMLCLLEQLKIDFIPEVSSRKENFSWLNNYRYDFYARINNKDILIEMDGSFHYKDLYQSRDEVTAIDLLKDKLANEHGMHVVRINCDYGHNNRYLFIKHNILQSELSNILCFDEIDWELCDRQANSSLVKVVCDYWNNGTRNATEIAKLIQISRSTARKYLKIGATLGLCDYTVEQGKSTNRQLCGEKLKDLQSKCVAVYLNESIVGVFCSGAELERQSELRFGVKFSQSTVSQHCTGVLKKTRSGYTMKYITHEEYEQFYPLFNSTIQNECNNLQEVV